MRKELSWCCGSPVNSFCLLVSMQCSQDQHVPSSVLSTNGQRYRLEVK
jgi:hypothetical protein